MLSCETLSAAIKARIERVDLQDDQLVPDHVMRMIDRIMEDYTVAAHGVDASDTDEGCYKRIHVYYTEFLKQLAPSLHHAATRHFERYMAALRRGEQAPQYNIWTDGVEVYAA